MKEGRLPNNCTKPHMFEQNYLAQFLPSLHAAVVFDAVKVVGILCTLQCCLIMSV